MRHKRLGRRGRPLRASGRLGRDTTTSCDPRWARGLGPEGVTRSLQRRSAPCRTSCRTPCRS